jgi:hypothetical protein
LDETGKYNGTPTGSPNLTFVQGYAGEAISFTPNSNQMVSTSLTLLANQSFTAAAWLYPISLTNSIHISICGQCPAAATDWCLHMTLQNSGSYYRLYYGQYADDVSNNTKPIVANTWIHAAYTYDATTRVASIYENGILLTAKTLSSLLQAKNGTFAIGNLPLLVPTITTFEVQIY